MNRYCAHACGLILVLVSASGARADTSVEAGFSYENLDNGFSDWRSRYVSGAWHPERDRALYGSLRETERFDLDDAEAMAGIYHPVSPALTVHAEASASATHRVLPKWTTLVQFQYALPAGVGVHVGVRHADYLDARVNDVRLTVERYFSDYRIAYVATGSRLVDGDSALTHVLQAAYYYGEDSFVGVTAAFGEEVESLGASGVTVTDVAGGALTGRHALTGAWSLVWHAGSHEQGKRYTRNAVGAGFRYRF